MKLNKKIIKIKQIKKKLKSNRIYNFYKLKNKLQKKL